MPFTQGEVVGDYEILGVLGRGGMGAVYRVRNLISDRVEAMKELLADVEQTPDRGERFLREIRVHATLRHPNIAELLTAFRRDNHLLMVMELVEGEDLDAILQRGPLPAGAAADCLAQVLEALKYAHARGVVHRDIKPSNIVVLPEGTVKLLDFGIARADTDRRLTHSGMVVGSVAYMSPEQVSGQAADARSDLYSIGVTLYQAITGVPPFRAESTYALMHAQLSQIPDAPAIVNPKIPAVLSEIVMRSLEKDPAGRFQTAAEFRAALDPFRHGETLTMAQHGATPAAPNAPVAPPPTRVPSNPQLDSSALDTIARNLAPFIGPIARRLVETRSRRAATTDELCRTLAEEIPSASGREAFLSACRQHFPPPPGTSDAASARLDPALLERARRELANYVGPLAKVIVDRAAKKARTEPDLLALLAAEIEEPAGRRRFLRAIGAAGADI